tara:strand:+ start:181 stop:390 length:210 start_codon:yes stop_codon:yes gene_type:complete
VVTVTKVMVSTLHVQHPTQVKEIMVVLVLVMAVVEAVVPVLLEILPLPLRVVMVEMEHRAYMHMVHLIQ